MRLLGIEFILQELKVLPVDISRLSCEVIPEIFTVEPVLASTSSDDILTAQSGTLMLAPVEVRTRERSEAVLIDTSTWPF